MDDTRARRITDALGRDPGLIIVTGRLGGGEMRIYGRPLLKDHERTFGAVEAEAAAVTSSALGLAAMHQLALIVQFEPAA